MTDVARPSGLRGFWLYTLVGSAAACGVVFVVGQYGSPEVEAGPAITLPEVDVADSFIHVMHRARGRSPILLLEGDPAAAAETTRPRPGSPVPRSLEWPDGFAELRDELDAARANPDLEMVAFIAEVHACYHGQLALRVVERLHGRDDADIELDSVHCRESPEGIHVTPGGCVPYGTWQRGGLVVLTPHHGRYGGTLYARWYGLQPSDVALLTQP